MDKLLVVMADICHILKILVICRVHIGLEERIGARYRYLLTFILTIIASLSMNFCENRNVDVLIYLVCSQVIVLICYMDKWWKLIICSIWSIVMIEIVNMMSLLSFDTINRIFGLWNKKEMNLLGEFVSLLFIVVVGWLLHRVSENGLKNIEVKYLIMVSTIMILDSLVMYAMVETAVEAALVKNKLAYAMSFTFVSAGMYIQIAALLLLALSKNEYMKKEYLVKQCLAEQISYYEYLEQRERNTKKFRHDIRNHLFLLNKLKQDGNIEEFDNYFQAILDSFCELENKIDVGNYIVNALLNKGYFDAADRGVELKVSGHMPNKCNVSIYDLCTIIFNLLNNAIEAASLSDEKEVWVVCQYDATDIIMEIGNYHCNRLRIRDGKFYSQKEKNGYHGWGLENVKDSVDKNGGVMDVDVTDSTFVVSISLKNESV